jgi:biotin synthase
MDQSTPQFTKTAALAAALGLFELPLNDLLYRAHTVHRENFDANRIQASTLLNIKTGGCSEDCAYCAQSVHYDTGLANEPLMKLEDVRTAARNAKRGGASRFCMGAAWRSPSDRQIGRLTEMVGVVKEEGLEACATLGMLTDSQAASLKEAGLDYYNHNVDTSETYYSKIITTRTYQDRLDTLARVRAAGMKVCSGGIVGMGETREDRAGMLATLVALDPQPESVPINMLVPIAGTPLSAVQPLDAIELVRTIAVARILMPKAYVRLSAGRESLDEAGQALCFFAGANSVFLGEKLLTTPNRDLDDDARMFARLGLTAG